MESVWKVIYMKLRNCSMQKRSWNRSSSRQLLLDTTNRHSTRTAILWGTWSSPPSLDSKCRMPYMGTPTSRYAWASWVLPWQHAQEEGSALSWAICISTRDVGGQGTELCSQIESSLSNLFQHTVTLPVNKVFSHVQVAHPVLHFEPISSRSVDKYH